MHVEKTIEIIQWKLTNDMFTNWNHLSCSNKIGDDCVINTLAFLKLIDKNLAKELSNRTNFRKDGLTFEQVNYMLMDQNLNLKNQNQDTSNKHVVVHTIEKNDPEGCQRFVKGVFHSYGTIIAVEYETRGAHALVYAKDIDGINYLYDPQSMVLLKDDAVIAYLNTNVKRFYYWKLVTNEDSDEKLKPGNLHKRKFGTITPENQKKSKVSKKNITKRVRVWSNKRRPSISKKLSFTKRISKKRKFSDTLPSNDMNEMEHLFSRLRIR